jgi:transposase
MHVKVTTSGSRQYVQLVESYRDDSGRVKKRTVATLGRLDQLGGDLDSVIRGLMKITGQDPSRLVSPEITFESAKAFGDLWALTELWNTLGFSDLRKVFHAARFSRDVESCIRAMVFNRLCDPDSKLGVLRWLETVSMPGLPEQGLTHQQLLRSMDALVEHQSSVDRVTATLLRPLIDQDLSMVFYDLTTIRTEGLSHPAGDVRQFGMSKEGVIARQFMLGIVQTADGLPIYHAVFDGNASETKTLQPTIKIILDRFPSIRRLILAADRGLLSLENLEALQAFNLSSGEPLEFILAVPGRRYADFADLLDGFHDRNGKAVDQESIGELAWEGLRLVVAHDPIRAQEQKQRRDQKIESLLTEAERRVGKLDAQDEGAKFRGRKLSDSGATAKLYREVCEAHLSRIIEVNLTSDTLAYEVNPKALKLAEQMDGKLLLVTNTPDLTPEDVVCRYKSLADIERGFRVMKSALEIGPVYHRLPDRIRAHAAICFMSLILYRVMRMRLKAANTNTSPERALEILRRIQHHRVRLNAQEPMTGLSSITPEQVDLFKALSVKRPASTLS